MRFLQVALRRVALIALVTVFSLALLAWPAQAAPPAQESQAAITSPVDGQEIAGTLAINGSASHPEFMRYELAFGPDPNPKDAWQVFSENNQPVANNVLGSWNTTSVADGTYMLRLRVVRKDSNYSEAFVRGLAVRNQQPTKTPTPSAPAPTFEPEATQAPAAEVDASVSTPILVEQPPTSVPAAVLPKGTGSPSVGNTTRGSTDSASPVIGDLLKSACLGGIVWSFGLFGLLGMIQTGRYGYKQILRQQRRQRKKT
ncbi:MAG TPA: hypothetical protein VII92_16765 [Anaerolineae bacterium]